MKLPSIALGVSLLLSQSAFAVSPIAFVGPGGVAPGHLVTAYNDGLYSHFLYAVNGGLGAELNAVEMGISSPFQYTRAHQCGVRVWVR